MSFSLQKANFWKRISAFMFDAILAFCLTFVFVIAFSALFQNQKYSDAIKAERVAIEQKYEELYEEKYGIPFDLDLNMPKADFETLTVEQKEIFEEAYAEFLKDENVVVSYRSLLMLIFANVSLSLFLADIVVYFIVPILFKNGQTLGKKCFNLAVMRTNGVKVSKPILFVRSVLGLYAMETMAPLLIFGMMLIGILGTVGTITLLLFAGLEIGVMIATKTNSSIHDLLSDTVVVDMGSQKIFESEEERLEYEKEEAAKKAAEASSDNRPIATGVFAPKTQPAQPVQAMQPIVAEPVVVKPIETEAQPNATEQIEATAAQATEPKTETVTPQTAEENAENSAQ